MKFGWLPNKRSRKFVDFHLYGESKINAKINENRETIKLNSVFHFGVVVFAFHSATESNETSVQMNWMTKVVHVINIHGNKRNEIKWIMHGVPNAKRLWRIMSSCFWFSQFTKTELWLISHTIFGNNQKRKKRWAFVSKMHRLKINFIAYLSKRT